MIAPDLDGTTLVNMARSDAEHRTGIKATLWQVESRSPRIWPNGSLGVQEPGMMYPQVPTPGYLIVLRHGDRHLEYHAGQTLVKFAGEAVIGPSPAGRAL